MEFKSITRSLTFQVVQPDGLNMWDKLGSEMSINLGDDPKEGYRMMEKLMIEAHKEKFPSSVIVADNEPIPEEQVKKTPLQSMIEAITTCTEVSTLKTFEKLAKSKPEFQEAYNETMIRLTNKR